MSAIEQHAASLWPQAAAATNLGDWPRVHGLLDELHSVMASSELSAETRESLEAGIGLVLGRLPGPRSIFDAPAASAAATGSSGDEEQSCATDASGGASSSAGRVPVVGLMITKDDENVLREWLEANGALLDGLVLLDGSRSNASRDIVREHVARSAPPLRLHYMHEDAQPAFARDAKKNDQTLRRVVHTRIRSLFGSGVWVMLCHPDEFFYHDPRRVAAAAQADGADHVFWWALHVLPHPSERAAHEAGRAPLVQQRFRHFHHSFEGFGHPFLEGRLFHDMPGVEYASQHFVTLPAAGLRAPWRRLGAAWLDDWHRTAEAQLVRGPAYLHYKVIEAEPSQYEARRYPSARRPGETFTFWAHRDHFRGDGAAPTGMQTDLSSVEGFFIEQFESYAENTRFTGCLRPFAWSLPEEYRANRTWPLGEGEGACE